MILEELASELALELKRVGYKKKRLTWTKDNGVIVLVFSIQRSMYDTDVWQYYFGLCVKPICKTKTISVSSCHFWERLDQTTNEHTWTAQDIASLVNRWEELYGTPEKLKKKALEGNLPMICSSEGVQYISSIQ